MVQRVIKQVCGVNGCKVMATMTLEFGDGFDTLSKKDQRRALRDMRKKFVKDLAKHHVAGHPKGAKE